MVKAVEVASIVYCAEAWRLEHGLGLVPGNRTARDAGDRHHARKAAVERIAGAAVAAGRFLAAMALVLSLWGWL